MPRVRVNGIACNIEEAGSGAPLVLLHGFTGSSAAWAPLSDELARHFRVLTVDLPGHGKSDAPGDAGRYRVEACVADLAELLDRLALPRAHWLGYSMGGRVALAFAAAFPQRVSRLVLEGASPGLENERERAERVAADEALARRIEQAGVEAFVTEWMRQPLFASQSRLPAAVRERQRAVRLANSAQGLANSLRGAGTGAQPSYWHRLGEITMPVLLVVGDEDVKFQVIARRMAALLPNARLAVIAGAGHTAHLENPLLFAQHVLSFLQEGSPEDRLSREARRHIEGGRHVD